MKEKLMFVTNNMKSLRNRVGLKQDDVAKKLNTSRATYCGYEVNPKKVTIETLYKLSNIFNCKLSDFFTENKVTKSNNNKEN